MHRLFFVVAAAAAAPPQWWSHDWSTAQAMQFVDFGYQLMNDEQAAFVASHYRVVSIEKCTGFWDWPSRSTEQAFLESAARLKRHNPSVRTLLYWDTDQASLQCYAGAAKLLAQPGWWLRGVDGAVLYADTARAIPYLNTSVPEGRAWWIGVPLGVAAAANIMDGVLVDGTGSRCPGGLAADACAAYVDGKFAMVAALRAALANGAVVLGNGLSLYSPAHNNDLDTLAGMDGIMLEHFAVFEQIRPDGAINVPLAAQALARVAEAAATGAAVVMACWQGPYTDAFDVHGFPGWAGAQAAPTTNEGWRAALLRYAPFALAAFLTVAEANVFMQYQAWYNGFSQGAIPCDAANTTCAAPLSTTWYPEWSQPIGAPLGPAVRVGNVWTRNFTFATSVLDLDSPLAGSRVTPKQTTPAIHENTTRLTTPAGTTTSTAFIHENTTRQTTPAVTTSTAFIHENTTTRQTTPAGTTAIALFYENTTRQTTPAGTTAIVFIHETTPAPADGTAGATAGAIVGLAVGVVLAVMAVVAVLLSVV